MEALNKMSNIISQEAKEIIYKKGLHEILNKYGVPVYHGSFELDLMTWRDLDIYLVNDNHTEIQHFGLGKEISLCLKPYKMSYRNEIIAKSEMLPRGLYWGIYTDSVFPEIWKIDIWTIDNEQAVKYAKQMNGIKTHLNDENRRAILEIKHNCCKHPEYRKKFFSMDIYHAVFENRIQSFAEFVAWLQKNRAINL